MPSVVGKITKGAVFDYLVDAAALQPVGTDRFFYVDHSGLVQELVLGPNGWVLVSQGPTAAPAFVPPPVGVIGPPGLDGVDGEPGPPGIAGTAGAAGSAGATGAVGATGPPGMGEQGEDGLPGPPGVPGAVGAAGSMGPPGIAGEDGEPGPPIPGPAGAAGATGSAGAAGAAGAIGPPGWDGEQGEMGFPGPPGPSGAGVGGGASTALDNLASVAINTSLLSDTDDTDDLGSTAKFWKRLYAKKLILGPDSELTIAAGAITVTQGYHRVDTTGDASTTNLDTIVGGVDGMILVLRPENDARTVVVRHNQGAASGNNILLADDSPFVMDNEDDVLVLIYEAGLDTNGAWIEVCRNARHPYYQGVVPGMLSVGTKKTILRVKEAFLATKLYGDLYDPPSGLSVKFTVYKNEFTSMGQVEITDIHGSFVTAQALLAGDWLNIVVDQVGTSPNEGGWLTWGVE